MAKYKVAVIAYQLKNQSVSVFGDIIDDSELSGNAAELIEQGFIALAENESENESENEDIALEDLTVKELIEFSELNKIDIGKNTKKEDILNAIEKSLEQDNEK